MNKSKKVHTMVESIKCTGGATNGRTNLHRIKIRRLTIKSSETLLRNQTKFTAHHNTRSKTQQKKYQSARKSLNFEKKQEVGWEELTIEKLSRTRGETVQLLVSCTKLEKITIN